MIIHQIYIEKYDWTTRIYYINSLSFNSIILNDIQSICSKEEYESIDFNDVSINSGFIYSNYIHRISIIVIFKQSSTEEFINTFDHEKGHLAMHICIAYNIDPFSEEYQYLTGTIGKKLHNFSKQFICKIQ